MHPKLTNTSDGAAQRWILRDLKHSGSIREDWPPQAKGTCDVSHADLRLMLAFTVKT